MDKGSSQDEYMDDPYDPRKKSKEESKSFYDNQFESLQPYSHSDDSKGINQYPKQKPNETWEVPMTQEDQEENLKRALKEQYYIKNSKVPFDQMIEQAFMYEKELGFMQRSKMTSDLLKEYADELLNDGELAMFKSRSRIIKFTAFCLTHALPFAVVLKVSPDLVKHLPSYIQAKKLWAISAVSAFTVLTTSINQNQFLASAS